MVSNREVPYSTLLLYFTKKKGQGKKCVIDALVQRGWSLNIPIGIMYMRGTEPPNSPQEINVRIMPISWPHPLTPAEKLPSYQLLNMQVEYIQTGIYDKNLLYDTAQLISFPDITPDGDNAGRVQLHDKIEKIFSVTVNIPADFPNDIVSKPVFLELSGKVEVLNIEACMTLCILVIG